MSLLSVISAICHRGPEYFCPNCGAILNDQDGFGPDDGNWICTECRMHLYDEQYEGDFYKDVLWYCDGCGAFLNKQIGFTETESTWVCEECGFENSITEKDIYVRAKK